MTVGDPKQQVLAEGQQRAVDAATTTTGSLIDDDDSEAWETLREIGYENGDYVPLFSHSTYSRGRSDTNTSYSSSNTYHELRLRLGRLAPSTAQFAVNLSYFAQAGSGETMSIRVRDTDNSETHVEVTGIGDGGTTTDTGWTEFTPSNPGSMSVMYIHTKCSSGSSSYEIRSPNIMYGVKI